MKSMKSARVYTQQHGGGTFGLVSLEPLDAERSPWWAVGLFGEEMPVHASDASFAAAYIGILARVQNDQLYHEYNHLALGTWVDDGTLYMDLVTLQTDAQAAVDLALAHDQLAVYHLQTGVTLRIERGDA